MPFPFVMSAPTAKSLFLRALACVLPLLAAVQAVAQPLPSFAELERARARIGAIRVTPGPIFDPTDPEEDKALFRLADSLHARTRPGVIERALLFKTGDLMSVAVMEESERVLRTARYLHEVKIRPVAYRDGVVDIEVATQDTW